MRRAIQACMGMFWCPPICGGSEVSTQRMNSRSVLADGQTISGGEISEDSQNRDTYVSAPDPIDLSSYSRGWMEFGQYSLKLQIESG